MEVDFAQEDPSKYVPRLEDSLKEVDVGILVNNVGLSYEYPNEFLNLESSAVDDIINVNISSLNAMTRILLKVDRFSLQFSINGSLYRLILLAMHIFKIFFTYLANGRTEKWRRYQCIFSKWNNGKKNFFFCYKLCL